jgi:hypothetical protein
MPKPRVRTRATKARNAIAVLAHALVFAGSIAHATDEIICSGTIATIGVHGTNRVMLRLTGMNTVVQICNLEQTMGTTAPISATQCKAAYATLLTAYTIGKTLTIYFDNVATGTSCTTFAPWEAAPARWVALSD